MSGLRSRFRRRSLLVQGRYLCRILGDLCRSPLEVVAIVRLHDEFGGVFADQGHDASDRRNDYPGIARYADAFQKHISLGIRGGSGSDNGLRGGGESVVEVMSGAISESPLGVGLEEGVPATVTGVFGDAPLGADAVSPDCATTWQKRQRNQREKKDNTLGEPQHDEISSPRRLCATTMFSGMICHGFDLPRCCRNSDDVFMYISIIITLFRLE